MRIAKTPARLLLTIAGALVLCLAFYAGTVDGARPRHLRVAAYGEARAQVIASQARQAGEGFVLLAGDSHAELALPEAPSCGRRILNAGLSGAKADDYALFLRRLALPRRASVAVVTLGTNHLLLKRNPAGKAAADRYEEDLAGVVGILRGMADRIVVAAVPPAGAALDRFIDRAGVANLTARQAAVCARLGCETVDPYAAYRAADFGTALQEATADGLHLSDYRPAYRSVDAILCR